MVIEDLQMQLRTLEGGRKQLSSEDRGMLKDVRGFISRALQGGDPESAPVFARVGREWAMDLLMNRWESLSSQLVRLNHALIDTWQITSGARRRELLREVVREIFDPEARPAYHRSPAPTIDEAMRRVLREGLVAWKDSQGRLSSRMMQGRLAELHLLEPDDEPRVSALGRYFLTLEPRRALTFLLLCELEIGRTEPRRMKNFLRKGRSFTSDEDPPDELSLMQAEWLAAIGAADSDDIFYYFPTAEGRLALEAALAEQGGAWARLIHALAGQSYRLEREQAGPAAADGDLASAGRAVAQVVEPALASFQRELEALAARAAQGDEIQRGEIDRVAAAIGASRELVITYLRYVDIGGGLPERFSVAEVMEEALALVRPRAARVDWSLHVAPGTPAVLGPRALLLRALTAVLENAAEVLADLPQGRCALFVRPVEGAERVEMVISDNGPGLPPEIAAAPFEPHPGLRPGHAGMGLALVRRVIGVAFRGEVHHRPNVAGGADFMLLVASESART